MAEVPFAAQGYGAMFTMGLMDRFHRPDMNLEEGLDLLRKCVDELKKRFIVDLGTWKVRVIDRQGIKEVTL
jgi:20S proteasome subunit beta 4